MQIQYEPLKEDEYSHLDRGEVDFQTRVSDLKIR